jgi:NAD(P)-dependent dehydrogenase (short-subunit alcohol dehydrogenase family)
MDTFTGRVAVVTGAASGIGLALARALGAGGAHVVMADVDPVRLEAAAGSVGTNQGGEVIAVPTDVTDWQSVSRLAERTRDRFGGAHVLCNNAGVQRPGRLWKVRPADFEWLVRVNLLGAFHGISAFVPDMIARGEPAHVVNTASISGLLGFSRIGAYAATKFGVVGLSESLRHDLVERGAPIGVSVLCPGAVATKLLVNSAALREPEAPAAEADPDEAGLDPADVAGRVLDAIKEDRFWILTHPGYRQLLQQRADWMLGTAEPPASPGFSL